ncbi:transposase [Leucobacter sp. W1038]|uniref:transposase n=1 Tax=Leucobacter sp. W1038 TaxID=3438281 RepID=UPI003D95F2CE
MGRSRGGLSTKTHQLVDGRGLPLVTICTAGQDGDSPMFIPLMKQVQVGRRTKPEAALCDKADSSRKNREYLRAHRIEVVIPEPRDQQANRKRHGSKGGQTTEIRCREVPGTERGRTRVLPTQAMARTRDPIRQARDRVPGRSRPQRHHRLATAFNRHALARTAVCGVPLGHGYTSWRVQG